MESIKHLEAHRFDRIKAEVKDGELIVTGEREATQKTAGLGGEFTYCMLGAAMEMDKLLTGENLPAFDQLGALLYHMATNQARPIAAEPLEVAGVGYLGESSARHVWLIYRPDLDFLKSRDATLTLSRAKAIAQSKPDKPHLVYAQTRFVAKRVLEERWRGSLNHVVARAFREGRVLYGTDGARGLHAAAGEAGSHRSGRPGRDGTDRRVECDLVLMSEWKTRLPKKFQD